MAQPFSAEHSEPPSREQGCVCYGVERCDLALLAKFHNNIQSVAAVQ